MKILGMDYTVRLMDGKAGETSNFGTCDNTECTIDLARGLSRQQVEATLIHEIIEATISMLDLGLGEATVRCLERGVHGALIDCGVNLAPLRKQVPEP